MKLEINYKTFTEAIEYRFKTQPNDIAYEYFFDEEGSISITYGELEQKVKALASIMQKKGLFQKKALLLYTPSLDFIIAFIACLFAGVVAVPAYPPEVNRIKYTMKRLTAIILNAEATTILTTVELYNQAKSIFAQIPENNFAQLDWITSDKTDINLAKEWFFPDITEKSIAFLQYTSGSTSDPKGVMINHQNILYNEEMMKIALNHEEQKSVLVCWVPFYHDMGLIGHLLQTIYIGSKSLIMSPIAFLRNPYKWLKLVSDNNEVSSAAPNFAYELCIKKISPEQAKTLDLSKFRNICNAAEPINHSTVERFIEYFSISKLKNTAVRTLYGLAEATVYVASSEFQKPPFYLTVKKSALENNKIVITDETDLDKTTLVSSGINIFEEQKTLIVNPETKKICLDNEVGELWVSGKHIAQGYWKLKEQTKETFENYLADFSEMPFLRTGDLGFFHENKLFITGRIKDLIIISGRNLYPQDIERDVEALRKIYPQIRAGCGACFSVELEGKENLVFFQEIDTKQETNLDSLLAEIANTIVKNHNIPVYDIVLLKAGSIAKTSSGKIMRQACKKAFINKMKDQSFRNKVALAPCDKDDISTSIVSSALAPCGKDNISTSKISSIKDDTERETRVEYSSRSIPQPNLSSKNHKKTELITWLTNKIATEINISVKEIDISKPFSFYGIDSATSVSLVKDLEDFIKKPLYPTIFWDYQNISELVSFLIEEKTETIEKTEENSNTDKVAIIGYACRLPNGIENTQDYWELLKNCRDGITEIPSDRWDLDKYYSSKKGEKGKMYVNKGGFINNIYDFEPEFFGISPKEALSIDPQQRLLLEVSYEALENSFITPSSLKKSNTGVFIGISSNDYSKLNLNSGNPENIDPYCGTGNAFSVAGGRISYTFDFHGANIAVDTACSSSLVSTHLAIKSLLNKESDLALAGGVNLIISPDLHLYFCSLNALSSDGYCKAFDDSADGYVRSEGCGIVVLKRLSDALKDNDNIIAVVSASNINHDGASNGLTAPNGLAQKKLSEKTLLQSGYSANDITYLETHGTGTPLGDPIELNALSEVYCLNRNKDNKLVLGAVKSNIGHTEAASGIASLIKILLCMENNLITNNLHFKNLNQNIRVNPNCFEINTEPKVWTGKKIAAINSFGISGTNAHLILESYEKPKKTTPKKPFNLLTISAKNEESLIKNIAKNLDFIKSNPDLKDEDFCYTSINREHHEKRFSVVYENKVDLEEKITTFLNHELILGVNHDEVVQNPKIAFVFSGQGSQWLGMGKKLYEKELVFKNIIDECETHIKKYAGFSITELIKTNISEEEFEKIEIIQPALFAMQIALAKLWINYGVTPECIIGHSMGEVAGTHIAGFIDLETAIKIICLRSSLMKQKSNQGSMLYAEIDEKYAEELASKTDGLVTVGVYNSKNSLVFSGESQKIATISETLTNEGFFNKLVKVNVASHSYQMKDLENSFLEGLGEITNLSNNYPMYSTVTNLELKAGELNASYWIDNLLKPVRFYQTVEKVLENKVNIFIEISPNPVLIKSLEKITGKSNLISSINKDENDYFSFYDSLSKAYCIGLNIEHNKVYPEGNKVFLPNYQWNKKTYRQKLEKSNIAGFYTLADGTIFYDIKLDYETLPTISKQTGFYSFFIEVISTAMQEVFKTNYALENLILHELKDLKEQTKLQIIFSPSTQKSMFKVYGINESENIFYCSGFYVKE